MAKSNSKPAKPIRPRAATPAIGMRENREITTTTVSAAATIIKTNIEEKNGEALLIIVQEIKGAILEHDKWAREEVLRFNPKRK